MSHNIHLANAKGRDAYVALATLKAQAAPKLSLPGDPVTFRRYVTCTESGTLICPASVTANRWIFVAEMKEVITVGITTCLF
jgi:hypothetical protein